MKDAQNILLAVAVLAGIYLCFGVLVGIAYILFILIYNQICEDHEKCSFKFIITGFFKVIYMWPLVVAVLVYLVWHLSMNWLTRGWWGRWMKGNA